MHFVTKVLVVFCAILSLLLAALTMAYATNADRIRASFEAEREQKLQYLAQYQGQVEGIATEKAAIQERLANAQKQVDDLNKEHNSLQAERTELRAQVEQAKADAIAIRNQIQQLGATTDSQQALIKNYREEVTKLRDDFVSAAKREIDLQDRINELDSQNEVLTQNARALREQLEETKLALQSAQSGGSGVSGASLTSEPRELIGPLVRARVLEVVNSPTGDLVVISEGANRGLKENILLSVTRGDTFVGSIVLTKVEPSTSVGRINLYGRKGVQVLKDDVVLSRLQ